MDNTTTPGNEIGVSPKNQIILSTGQVAVIEEGEGSHSVEALKMAGNDSSQYLNCLMSLLITIDGDHKVPEDLLKLKLKDYTTLQSAFSSQNF